MFATLSLIRREFTAYFLSPIAYVVLVVFLFVTGHLFYLALTLLTEHGPRGIEYPMQVMFGDERFWLVFLFIPPLLTMRLFAEERSTGTLEMLMTAPLRDWQVVLCKYLACLAFYVFLWVPTLAYLPVLLNVQGDWPVAWTPASILLAVGVSLALLGPPVIVFTTHPVARWLAALLTLGGVAAAGAGAWLGTNRFTEPLYGLAARIDPMPVVSSYLGVLLAGAMFLALGMFVSSLVRSQMVAALVALLLSLGFIVAGFWRPEMDTGSTFYRVLYFFSVPLHFSRDFSRGVLDTRHLVLYGSVALFCLFLTVRSLEGRRWR